MTDHAPETHSLSPDGTRRREAMLGTLLDEMRRRREGRRARRRAAAAMLMVALALGVALLALPRHRNAPERIAGTVHEGDAPVATTDSPDAPMPMPSPRFVVVQTDHAILERYTASGSLRLVQFMSDDELVLALAAIERPTGLIRIGDRVMLTASVTDEPDRDGRFSPPRPPL